MMRLRIGLLIPLALGLLAVPLAAAAPPRANVPRIGWLSSDFPPSDADRQPIGITITGGASWSREPSDPHQWHVAKIQLVGMVQRFLQSGRLRIGAKLTHASTLQRELRDFRVKISKAANETYEAREGAHDDLVLALAIGLFVAEHEGPPAQDVDPAEIQRIQREAGILKPALPDSRIGQCLWSGGRQRHYW